MKKPLMLTLLVLVFLLAGTTAASANIIWSFKIRNNTAAPVNDAHLKVWEDPAQTTPLGVVASGVNGPLGWAVTGIAGNAVDMANTSGLAANDIPPGGMLDFWIETPDSTTCFTFGEWTVNGDPVGNVAESNLYRVVKVAVPRTIKLTVRQNDINFGMQRPGQGARRQVQAMVETNGEAFDLFAAGQDVEPHNSLLGMLSLEAPEDVGGLGPQRMPSPGQNVMLMEQSRAVGSFFDVFFDLQLPETLKPGSYRMNVNLNAVANY